VKGTLEEILPARREDEAYERREEEAEADPRNARAKPSISPAAATIAGEGSPGGEGRSERVASRSAAATARAEAGLSAGSAERHLWMTRSTAGRTPGRGW